MFDYLFSENGVVGFKGTQPYPVLVRLPDFYLKI